MPSLADVQKAHAFLKGAVRHTPMKRSSSLGALTGGEFHLKLENFQLTGSFKVRGGLNKLHGLTPAERRNGVVAASAGNHAQGVAYAARKEGVKCDIFMPEEATLAKVVATKGYGATVHLVGRDYQEAYENALKFQAAHHATYVHAFDDPAIIAGQGTLGIEIAEDLPGIDTVLVPIGGGGLISGVATALKGLKPGVKVIGVQAAGASTIAPSLEKGRPVSLESVDTMADGIAVRNVGKVTWDIIRERVDQVVTVQESEIAAAILFLLERTKAVVEGAGAVTLAAAMHRKVNLEGRTACAVVSGGNIDMTLVSRIIRMGLVKEGRIAVVRATISDRPGGLAEFLTQLAKLKASVIDLHHDRHRPGMSLNRTGVEVHVETRGPEHIEEIRKSLKASGYDAQVTA
ncbi:MAG TPA: threonine ammonia-lyase [Candidatus Thermoplasmatota archaeon]|nr:threonine ammonia-lyase [Candidatus Thermoplasmatota archaeon]